MCNIYFLCAYSKTGKDSFYQYLSAKKSINHYDKWVLYNNDYSKHFISDKKYIRLAFADELKKEVSTIYNIDLLIDDKDKKQFRHYLTNEIVSARDIYIEWATIRKKEDKYYWVKKLINKILNYINDDVNIIITDWRFIEELSYIKQYFDNVYTVRLYRSEIAQPHSAIFSEHSLDNYLTDILLVSDNLNNFKQVLLYFPQYYNYNEKYII